MLDILAKICDDGGPLVGVSCTLFEGDPQFITAVGLQFESLSAVLRAVPDDDTLTVSLGMLAPEPGETLIDAADSGPWPVCMGLCVCWAWCLTNQQGYSDGVRLEFSEPGRVSRAVVEFVVAASAIYVLVAVPNRS
jgi:uncharacterized protein DUF6334